MIIDPQKIEEKKLTQLITPKNKKILEIGCGQGDIAIKIAPLCHRYIGIDVDKKSINQAKTAAKNVSNLTFFNKSGDKTGFKSETFDSVLMHLCLHEVPPQKQGLVLQEVHRLLKKNGQLIIVDPTEPAGQVQSIFNVGYQNFWFFHHSAVVQHSIEVIKQAITNGLYQPKDTVRLKVEFLFKNFNEVFSFVKDSFNEIIWNQQNINLLKNDLLKITGKQKQNIVLIDDLTITNLIKN